MKIETINIGGFSAAINALRLPYSGTSPSKIETDLVFDSQKIQISENCEIDDKDMKLLRALVKTGDSDAKVLRGVAVWARITAPLYWWNEATTYRVGVDCLSSTSTMHTECRGLRGEELQKAKAEIPMGHEQTRILMMSYQALRRIYFQRRNHRLPEWHDFCKWVESLPMAKELIIYGYED